MGERQPRKLAVILHADVVGSTALVHRDEVLAHERIRNAFARFSGVIRDYHGNTHELRGDALIAEFHRASDGVSAALSFQQQNTKSNTALGEGIQPQVRVGISLGEVVIADGTVTGAGVVLAQRVEQLAAPDGVCITGAIREALPQHLPFDYSDLGKQAVKGFDEPVQVYRAALKPGAPCPPPEPSASIYPWRQTRRGVWLASAAAVLLVGGLAWWRPWMPEPDSASMTRSVLPLPDNPSVAVLPFQNISGDPEQGYFADGMTDSIITDLSKIPDLFVVARNSSFAYKGKAKDIREIGKELGVKHVLEGSVQRAAGEVRINVQLIDATSGGHVWAERYDGAIEDLFKLQDVVIEKIVTALSPELTRVYSKPSRAVGTTKIEAYDAFLHGMQHYRRAAPDHYVKAVEYLNKSTALDADFNEVYAVLAAIYLTSYRRNFTRALGLEAFEAWNKTKENLRLAMRDPSAVAYQVASTLSLEFRRHDEAVAQAEKAVSIKPSDAEGHATLAQALIFSGMPVKALGSIQKARRLDPHNEFYYAFLQGLAEFNQDQFEDSVVSFERALELNPELWSAAAGWGCAPSAPLLSAYAHLERTQAVKELLAKGGFDCPIETIIERSWPYKEPSDAERLSQGLRIAGLRER